MRRENESNEIAILAIFIGGIILGLVFGYLTSMYHTELITLCVTVTLCVRLAMDVYSVRRKNAKQ